MLLSVFNSSRRVIALIGAGSSLALGCGGPSVADLVAEEVTLTVRGMASDPDVATIGDASTGLGVSRGALRARRIALEACRAGVDEVRLAPRGYELASDNASSEVVTTAVKDLCGVRVEIEATADNALDGVPEAASLYVEVSDSDGNPLRFMSDVSTTLRFETDLASSFGSQPLLLGIDFSKWLADLPLDPDMSEDASERLLAQLPGAAALFVDENANGIIDEAESEPLLAATP